MKYYITDFFFFFGRRLAKQIPDVKNILDELETMIDYKARPEDISTDVFCCVANLFYERNIIITSAN